LQMAHILVIGARGVPDVEGGAEKNAEQLFPRLVAAGYDVTLLGLAENVKAESYRGVKLLSAPTFWLLNTDKLFYYLAAIVLAIRVRPRIIHLQGLGAALFLWIYKLLGFRVVVRYGSADYILPKWGFLGRTGFRLSEYQLQFADAVISVSDTLTLRLQSKGIRERIHSIPNALDKPDPQWSANATSARPYIVAVGRVTSQKNIDTLLRAFARFSENNPTCELRVVGSLSDRRYVESLGPLMSPNVTMLGAVPRREIPALLSKCALYANLSHHEGNSNATLEAISHGCPVLVSDIPENHEMKLAPHNFVDQQDAKAIVAAFGAAFAHPEMFVVSRSGFLSWDEVAARTGKVYQAIL